MRFGEGLVPCDPLFGSVGVDDLQPQHQLLLLLRLRPRSSQHGRLHRRSPDVAKSGPVVVTWIQVRVVWWTENGEASQGREPMFEGVVFEIRLAGPEHRDRVRKDQARERPVHLGNPYGVAPRVSCG